MSPWMEWLPALVSHVWVSTLFLLAALGLQALLRHRLTAGARFSLVLVGLAKFAVPHALVAAGLRWLDAALQVDSRQALGAPLQAVAGALRVDFAPPPETRLWPALILALWAAVALGLLLRLARTHRRLAATWLPGTLPAQPREIAALERARRRTGARGPIGIARSPRPEAPAVLGIRRPTILLPLTGCDDLSDAELESLLSHECAHVARRDNLTAAGVSVLCALFWFHPLVWIARRVLGIERERACDEIAVGPGSGRDTYLTALAKFCHAAIGPELPGVARMATTPLKGRMEYLMRYPVLAHRSPSPTRAALLAAGALALFTVAAGFVGSSPIAFADVESHVSSAAAAIATPAPAPRATVAQAAVTLPAPETHRDRPQAQTARQQPKAEAVATASAGPAAAPQAEPAAAVQATACPFVKCQIVCGNGETRDQTFSNSLQCLGYSDAYGCRPSGAFSCTDKPAPTGC